MRPFILFLGLLTLTSCAPVQPDRDGGIGGTGAPAKTQAL